MTQRPPQPEAEAAPPPASKARNRAFRITQAPRFQNALEAFEAVAREEESGQKYAVTAGSDTLAWEELHRLLKSKGCGGPAIEDAEAGTEYNQLFFKEEE